MNQPVLSIDIAKGKSVAAAFSSYGSLVKKPFSFSHSPDDISALLPLLGQLGKSTTQRPDSPNYHEKILPIYSDLRTLSSLDDSNDLNQLFLLLLY
ncbi:hypothetical protein [Paenibacillus lautus]|uniref:hypothetical protein n=1 Tax=Paenibacillus lautus TaxID=1401 RepID=UPI003D2BB6A8